MVTAGTFRKEAFFHSAERLTYLATTILEVAAEHNWQLQAWAIFPNHYHFVGQSKEPASLRRLVQHLHSVSAKFVNRLDNSAGRTVWFQYWDSQITFSRSFFARLHYVHNNPVKHKLVSHAEAYPWCSAAWFARSATPSFYRTVMSFRSDRVDVNDDFEVAPVAR